MSLNYIPSFNFGKYKKKEKYLINVKHGIPEFNKNMTLNQTYQNWQEDILEQIQNSKTQQNLKTTYTIISLIQLYMDDWIEHPDLLGSIDKKILDYAQNSGSSIISSGKFSDTIEQLKLRKHQIQLKFLRYFDSMQDSEIVQLYENYQMLHQNLIDNASNQFYQKKIESYCQAQTLSLYLAAKWLDKSDENLDRDRIFELLKYGIVQLLNILDVLKTAEAEEGYIAERLMYALMRINYILEGLYVHGKEGKFLLEVAEKQENTLEMFKNLLPIQEYKLFKTNCIFAFIQLGYFEEALNSALRFYEFRFYSDKFTLGYYWFLYYCLIKTENTTYNLEELISEIEGEDFNNEDVVHYNLLISMQQLNRLIVDQKYEQLQPIITQLINKPQQTKVGRLIIFPLLCEILIFNPKIPNRLNYLSKLLSLFTSLNFSDIPSSNYQMCQRDLYKLMIEMIINLEKNNNQFSEFVPDIKNLFNLCQQNQDIQAQREIINSNIKLIPLIESLKTYGMLTEIIDLFLFLLQKDNKNEENKQWIEILNSNKTKLKQKYHK